MHLDLERVQLTWDGSLAGLQAFFEVGDEELPSIQDRTRIKSRCVLFVYVCVCTCVKTNQHHAGRM
jgi:hypothetical protein